MFRKRVTDDEGRHDVEFVLVHACSFDAASRTAERMAAVMTAAATCGHSACRWGLLTPLASGAEVLVPGTEADRVADAMIEVARWILHTTSHHKEH